MVNELTSRIDELSGTVPEAFMATPPTCAFIAVLKQKVSAMVAITVCSIFFI